MQLYPDWSSRANTTRGKKRKRKQDANEGGTYSRLKTSSTLRQYYHNYHSTQDYLRILYIVPSVWLTLLIIFFTKSFFVFLLIYF